MKLLYFLVPVLFFNDCKSQPVTRFPTNADDNTLLWEISGKGLSRPSFLFGTFHLMCKDDIQTSKNLSQALISSDEVYFELDMDDMANTLGALMFMKMRNDTVLKDLYTEAEYKKIESYFSDTLNMPMAFMQTIKPLFLQAFLYPKMMTCKKMSGVEESLMEIAKQHKKEIKGLETIALQASVFDSIPYSVQARELLKSIDSIDENKNDFDEMLRIYQSQKLSEIDKLTSEDMTVGENKTILLDNRNVNWVQQLKKLMPEKSLFIAVGAGHLTGKMGVIELLKKEGYTLRPIENRLK